jgi:hypothetical protein
MNVPIKAQTINFNRLTKTELERVGIVVQQSTNDSLIQFNGRIKDSITSEAIPYAVIKIYQNGIVDTGALSDLNGIFFLSIPAKWFIGKSFNLSIQCLGYDTLFIRNIIANQTKFYMQVKLYPDKKVFIDTVRFTLPLDTLTRHTYKHADIEHMPYFH